MLENVVLAEYHCRYDWQDRKVKDVRDGVFYATQFASPQGLLLPLNPQESLVLYRPNPFMRQARLPFQSGNYGCLNSCTRRRGVLSSSELNGFLPTFGDMPLWNSLASSGGSPLYIFIPPRNYPDAVGTRTRRCPGGLHPWKKEPAFRLSTNTTVLTRLLPDAAPAP